MLKWGVVVALSIVGFNLEGILLIGCLGTQVLIPAIV